MQTKAIKGKIKTVGNIRKITKTMEMVSAAKMKKSVDAALAIQPFHNEALSILHDIGIDKTVRHPLLMSGNKDGKELIILVASNKGLCGGYNTQLMRKLAESTSQDERARTHVVTVGKFAEKIARRLSLHIVATFTAVPFTAKDARVITKLCTDSFEKGTYSSVRILFTHFIKAMTFVPTRTRLLPFSYEGEPDAFGEPRFEYEPSIEGVLSHVIPLMLENIIYGAVLESYASEHSSRMMAMKSATDNATEMLRDLKLYYNRARQDAVTQEISEIVSGAMALSS